MKQPYKTDIAVLLLFFNRPETFQQVFNEVKKARPSRLFLYQDGMRGERDRVGVEACRQIASDENIDWECEVHRLYQEKNLGCDPSEYVSQKWAFSIVDKCIVLEDDDVPSQAFFPFCNPTCQLIIFSPLFFLFGVGLLGEGLLIYGTATIHL